MRRTALTFTLLLAAVGCRRAATDGDGEWGGQEGEPVEDSGVDEEDDEDDELGSDTDDTDALTCNDTDPVTLFVSPDDSNSMASPVLARQAALTGQPGFSAIRPWEFLNYYDFAYPPAAAGELRVVPTLARDPSSPDDTFVLQVAVASEAVANDARRPLSLTFVVDNSCSMGGDAIDAVRDIGAVVAGNLREGDIVSVVTWSADQGALLQSHPVTGPLDPAVLDAFAGLTTGSTSDLHTGLTAGYALAEAEASADHLRRVVLMSDGGSDLRSADADLISRKAGTSQAEGIALVGVGVGRAATYNDALMDTVTDLGGGASVFVHDQAEATRVFGDRFVQTFDVAARDVRIRLDLPPGFEVVRSSGEATSSDPDEVDPQDLAPNDTMVLQQALTSCAPEHRGDDAPIVVTVDWRDPRTLEARQTVVTSTLGALLQDEPLMAKATAILAYADLLALPDPNDLALARAQAALDLAVAANPGDPDLAEVQRVLDAL